MDYAVKEICRKLKHAETGWTSGRVCSGLPLHLSGIPSIPPSSPHWLHLQTLPLWSQECFSTTASCNLIHTASENLQSPEQYSNEATQIILLTAARKCLPLIIMWDCVNSASLGDGRMLWSPYAKFEINVIQFVTLLHRTDRVLKGQSGCCKQKEMGARPYTPRHLMAWATLHSKPCVHVSRTS